MPRFFTSSYKGMNFENEREREREIGEYTRTIDYTVLWVRFNGFQKIFYSQSNSPFLYFNE